MATHRLQLGLLTLLVITAAIVGASGAAHTAGAQVPLQAPTAEPPREGPIPCDPSYTRSVEPRIVKEGDSVTVSAWYNFICSGEVRKVNVMFVVENSSQLRQGQGGREALDNIEKGARNFINQMDWARGSQGGLMLYAGNRTMRVPLTGGASAKTALLEAFANISIEGQGNSAGAGAAIRDSTQQLPVGIVTDASNVLIIVDAGAQEIAGDVLIDRFTACNAARQAGVTVAVLSFPAAQGRMRTCASSGWFYTLNSDEGRNAPEQFDKLAEGLLRGLQMQKVLYSDWPEDGFDYEINSGYPRDPDSVVMGELFWEFEGKTAPPTGQSIEYKFDVEPGVFSAGKIMPVSIWSHLEFTYQQGTSITVELPNPQICIYRASPRECDGFAASLTPTATSAASSTAPPTSPPTVPPTLRPTDQPTSQPTDVPTEEPTERPTGLPTEPTEPVIGFRIFLPVAYDKA